MMRPIDKTTEDCMSALRALPDTEVTEGQPPTQADHLKTWDAALNLKGRWGTVRYCVAIIPRLRPESLGKLSHDLARFPRGNRPLVFTQQVTPGIGKVLTEQGIDYVDAAGNMCLSASPLHVCIQGKHIPRQVDRPMRAFSRKALQLIYVLLRDPAAVRQTYRELAGDAGVALGTVDRTLNDLRQLGFIKPGEPRRLVNRPNLLHRWELGYMETLRPSLFATRCRLTDLQNVEHLAERVTTLPVTMATWVGGELGAAILTGHLQPIRATLHTTAEPQAVMVALRLAPDKNGPIDIIQTFGRRTAPPTPMGVSAPVADPLLVYAELLRDPDQRLRETAAMILDQHLAPRLMDENDI